MSFNQSAQSKPLRQGVLSVATTTLCWTLSVSDRINNVLMPRAAEEPPCALLGAPSGRAGARFPQATG
jgi:hypothetical protein